MHSLEYNNLAPSFSDSPPRYIPRILRVTVSIFATFSIFRFLPLTEIYIEVWLGIPWLMFSGRVYAMMEVGKQLVLEDIFSGSVLSFVWASTLLCALAVTLLARFSILSLVLYILFCLGLVCIFSVCLGIYYVLSAVTDWIGRRKGAILAIVRRTYFVRAYELYEVIDMEEIGTGQN
jgi:hypothetical protein